MALVAASSLIASLSGKTGSVNFARNPGGTVVRMNPLRLASPSEAQTNRRALLGQVTKSWRACTPQLRAGWQSLASQVLVTNRIGVTAPIKPYPLFVRENLLLLMSGQPTTLTPPVALRSQSSLPTYLAITPGVSYLAAWTPDGLQPRGRLLCYGSYAGSTTQYGPISWKFFGWYEINNQTFFDFRPEWLTVFSEIYSGSLFRLRVIYLPYLCLSAAPQEYAFQA